MHPVSNTSGPAAHRRGLYTHWERRTKRTAWLAAGLGLLVAALLGALLFPDVAWWLVLLLAAAVGLAIEYGMTARIRRRTAILAQPFPAEWEAVLQKDVAFYRTLDEQDRARFRAELQVFVREKRITGIKTELDTTTLVLVGASAVIPIFGFPEWEWDQISEVLVYPDRFDEDYRIGHAESTLGMVGSGAMNRLMILSRPDLIQGFRNAGDKRNVGIHEFAHLVDKSDGAIDGRPGVGLGAASSGPWIELVRRKMEEMRSGRSDINQYGLTNTAEFFAVASEYFFERPGVMQQKHPELYKMMAQAFGQDLALRTDDFRREILGGGRVIGRNSPCPCGSGEKYKRCCLKR